MVKTFTKLIKRTCKQEYASTGLSNIKEQIVKPIFEMVSKQLTCLFPNVEQSKYLTLSCTGGEGQKRLSTPIGLKWPNDMLLNIL